MVASTVTPLPVERALLRLGRNTRTWRTLRGLTQAQVADRAGITRPTLSKIENGTGNVSLESVLAVMRALGIMDQFVDSVDPLNSDVGRLRASEDLPQRVRQPRAPKARTVG